jgi:hypothetical protein
MFVQNQVSDSQDALNDFADDWKDITVHVIR